MNTIRFTLAVAWKELQLIFRELGALAIMLLLPLALGSLFAGANMSLAGGDGADIVLHVGLVNQDPGPFGAQVARTIDSIEQLDVQRFDTPADAEAQVAEGALIAAIVIPAGFSQQVDGYTPTALDVIVDPAEPQSASIVTGIMKQVVGEVTLWGEVQYGIRSVMADSGLFVGATEQQRRAFEAQNLGVLMTRLNELRSDPPIAVVTEDLAGATVKGGWEVFFGYLFAAFSVMFIFFIVGWAASSLLNERETGVLRRLTAAPIPRGAILVGKALAFITLPFLQVGLLFLVAHFVFGVSLGRSPVALVLLTLAVALAAVSLGLLLAAVTKNAKQADSVGTILAFVLAAVGGALPFGTEPLMRQPGLMGLLPQLTPQGHAVEGYFRIMAEDAGVMRVLPQIGALVGMALLFILVARWRFKWAQ